MQTTKILFVFLLQCTSSSLLNSIGAVSMLSDMILIQLRVYTIQFSWSSHLNGPHWMEMKHVNTKSAKLLTNLTIECFVQSRWSIKMELQSLRRINRLVFPWITTYKLCWKIVLSWKFSVFRIQCCLKNSTFRCRNYIFCSMFLVLLNR